MCVFLPPPVFVGEFLCIVCVSAKSVEESPSATAWNGNETEQRATCDQLAHQGVCATLCAARVLFMCTLCATLCAACDQLLHELYATCVQGATLPQLTYMETLLSR